MKILQPLFIFLGTLLFPIYSNAGPTPKSQKIKEIALSSTWLNLLYYESSGTNYRSAVPTPSFFMNPKDGPTSPIAELNSALQIFKSTTKSTGIHPQCRYPSRYKFLKNYFQLLPPVHCPKYEAWLKTYAPKKLSLVYASQYISNPASVFGHSFLLLPSPTQVKGFWLTFNYAATIPPETSGLGYIYGGMTGWFEGEYSVMPFYHRIFQYGNVENRDLWIYHLNFTDDEFDFILRHLWELVHTSKFTYYFFNENCAGILLRTFAATLKDMRKFKNLPLYVHPIAVIKAMKKVGRIQSVELIPSLANTLRTHVQQLTPKQKQQFFKIIRSPQKPIPQIAPPTSETLIQYTAFLTRKYKGELPSHFHNLERSALIQRSQHQTPPLPKLETDRMLEAPHLSHEESMLEPGVSHVNNNNALDITYRLALHDLLDRSPGFLKNSTTEIFKLTVSHSSQKTWLKNLTLIQIENFQNYVSYDPQASWRIGLSVKENLLSETLDNYFIQMNTSYGASFQISQILTYMLISGQINAGHELSQGHYQLGPEIGMIIDLRSIKMFVSFQAGQNLFEGSRHSFQKAKSGLRWSINQNLSLRQENEWHSLPHSQQEGHRLGISLRYQY